MNIVLDYAYNTLDAITDDVNWNLQCKISDLVKEIEIQTDMIDKLLKPKYEKMDGFDVWIWMYRGSRKLTKNDIKFIIQALKEYRIVDCPLIHELEGLIKWMIKTLSNQFLKLHSGIMQ